jgi:dTDP-4-dehydrorhamnose reductase
VVGLTRDVLDLEQAESVASVRDTRADVVIHCAAWTDVDGCARDPARALRINGTGARLIAEHVRQMGALFVLVSTNEVFDGRSAAAYTEHDTPRPITAYGRSKLAAERSVAALGGRFVIVRTAWLFGSDGSGFPKRISAAADVARRSGRALRVVADEWGNPTPAGALALAVMDLVGIAMRAAVPEIVHLAGEPPASRYEWARLILGPKASLEPIASAEYERDSKPPLYAILSMARARSLGISPIAWRM